MMEQTVVGVVRFGIGSGEEPTEEHWTFYEEVSALVMPRNTTAREQSGRPFFTVASVDVVGDESTIYRPLFQALKDVADDVDIAVLDLSVGTGKLESVLVVRPRAHDHIGSAVATALRQGDWSRRKLIILLPSRREGGLEQHLANEMASGKVVVLSDDGQSSWQAVDADEYLPLLLKLKTRPIDVFKYKLVTRLGWFRTERGPGEVLRHYFDAGGAQNELGVLLDRYVGVRDDKQRPDLVVYHQSSCSWLLEPLTGACIRADSLPRLAFEDVDKPCGPMADHHGKNVLLVVPVVNRGAALSAKVDSLVESLRPSELRVLAVLCHSGGEEFHGRRRLRTDKGRNYDVDYILRVRQETVPSNNPMVELCGTADPRSVIRDSLTTMEFWDLVRTCGVKAEEDVPRHRTGYCIVPDVPRILDEYGGWLAEMMLTAIRGKTMTQGQDLLLVCPKGESGATKLTKILSFMTGAKVLGIPRDAIQRVVDGEDVGTVLAGATPWSRQLDSVATKEVVLLDEFVGDGRTVRAMRAIANAKRLNVTAVCTLLDFCPDPVEDRHSLYGWRFRGGVRLPRQRRASTRTAAAS